MIDDVERCQQRITTIQQELAEHRHTVSAAVLSDIRECVRSGLTQAGRAPRVGLSPSRHP